MNNIIKIRDELKKLISDEEVVARHAQKRRSDALKVRHTVISAETLAPKYRNLPPQLDNFINKLLQKNLSIRQNRREKTENQSKEADEALKKLRELKQAGVIRLAEAIGVEPPAGIS